MTVTGEACIAKIYEGVVVLCESGFVFLVMANTWICIFGDRQHMGDWPPGVILSCWVWLSGTPSPERTAASQKPKLRQQLSSHSVCGLVGPHG